MYEVKYYPFVLDQVEFQSYFEMLHSSLPIYFWQQQKLAHQLYQEQI